MPSMFRLSKYGKIAAATAGSAGSLYYFRDHLKPLIGTSSKPDLINQKQETSIEKSRLIENLPEHVPYLLVGGGTASHSAMRAIRAHDARAKVLIISGENHRPYMRPALSKELWLAGPDMRQKFNFQWYGGKEKSIFYELDEFYIPLENFDKRENGGVSLITNTRLNHLDPDNRLAYLENGQSIKYDKCLLAPGGKPRVLPELDNVSDAIKDRIVYFRTADDFIRLDNIARTAKSILVIGGGFLGSELTCSLAIRAKTEANQEDDQRIFQIYPESGNLGKVLPEYLSEWVSKKISNEGAELIPNVEVKKVAMTNDKLVEIELTNGQTIQVDYIVCAIGHEPDVELAKLTGLEIDEKTGGYMVNSELEARTNVWVAGDASCFYDIKLGRRRVEHHDHAVNSGKLAGQNMVGAGKAYTHQSMFWSDLGRDISFEAVGIIDSSSPTVAVFSGESDKYDKGIVFYLKDDIIVGILLWNLFNRLTIARRILNEQRKYEDFNELAKLFNLYLDD